MNEDAELLSRYATERSEAAFAELTRRHVDLVYSAALRLMNGDLHSAQDVTQQVFTEVARQAKRLARHPAPVGWLYTTTRLIALRAQRTDQRRKAREQEANAMNELLHDDSPPSDWDQIRPVIEEAMHELDDKDRHAVLLRFFQNKSLSEVGAALQVTENAARMRVDRALDKLRGKLARRGITTTAAALGAVVSANAIQVAPAGLATTLSATAIAGSAVNTSIAIAATKTIAMTTLQKTIVAVTLTAAVGSGIYAVHRNSQLRDQVRTLQQERAPLAAQVQQLKQERDQATNRLAALRQEYALLKSGSNTAELLKLRGEVGVLRRQTAASEAKTDPPATGLAKLMNDPAMKEYIRRAQMEKIQSMYADFFKEMKLTPEQVNKFLELMTDNASRAVRLLTATAQNSSDQAEAAQAAATAYQEIVGQLRALLGDEGCARFKEYSDEIPARIVLSQLNGQLGDGSLSDDQNARLLRLVKAEPAEVTQGLTGAPDKAFLGSQADIDSFLQRVTQSNQHILEQAGSFLTPDQLAALDSILTKSIETRKLQAAALIQKH